MMLTKAFAMLVFYLVGALISYALSFSIVPVFLMCWLFVFYLFRPVYLISPLTLVHVYYFVFFIIAPLYAERHDADQFFDGQSIAIYSMVFLTYLLAITGVVYGQKKTLHSFGRYDKKLIFNDFNLKFAIGFLFILCTAIVLMIVLSSGGVAVWIASPGEAFLNRAGSGIYVILSHFSVFILAGFVGYYAHEKSNKKLLILFYIWLFLTSPVHGSKSLLIMIITISLIPWIRNLRLLTSFSLVFGVVMLAVFFLGLYFRNHSWMTLGELIPYSLNYFTALSNMMILVADFEPNLMQTFFLPFNKFLTPFGLSDPSLYYDMNHYLTDIYFPTAWEIRATEQWPVEADLYLNFYFVFGLPLIFGYFYVVGLIYAKARQSASLGLWVVSALMILSIPSHLRGSLYNHVDFYQYPMFFVVYLILKKLRLEDKRSK